MKKLFILALCLMPFAFQVKAANGDQLDVTASKTAPLLPPAPTPVLAQPTPAVPTPTPAIPVETKVAPTMPPAAEIEVGTISDESLFEALDEALEDTEPDISIEETEVSEDDFE